MKNQSALSFDDQLAVLKNNISQFFFSKGYKPLKEQKEILDKWSFEIVISSRHKKETIMVKMWTFRKGEQPVYQAVNETTSEMWEKANRFFEIPKFEDKYGKKIKPLKWED